MPLILIAFSCNVATDLLVDSSLWGGLLSLSHKQPLRAVAIEVDQFLEDMAALLRRTLGDRIQISIHVEDNQWRCFADKTQLESAVLNLAINARDAMPDGGEIEIKAYDVVRVRSTVVIPVVFCHWFCRSMYSSTESCPSLCRVIQEITSSAFSSGGNTG
jgi:hypothetical protein